MYLLQPSMHAIMPCAVAVCSSACAASSPGACNSIQIARLCQHSTVQYSTVQHSTMLQWRCVTYCSLGCCGWMLIRPLLFDTAAQVAVLSQLVYGLAREPTHDVECCGDGSCAHSVSMRLFSLLSCSACRDCLVALGGIQCCCDPGRTL
jgi:hypothetical protein